MINYKDILSAKRLRPTTKTGRNILTESESDRGRVLFCPAFRRLQQKAQVFSMEPNAAVRSRLTHSLEVSQVGRYLADEIGLKLAAARMVDDLEQGALVNFVETACLMHDIGNPPFGHFGEAAIQEWFKENGTECLLASQGLANNDPTVDAYREQIDFALQDFYQFDGNPQGLRVVAKLQWNTDEYGLNLTNTTLASFLKYVRSPVQHPSSAHFTRKPGFFVSETDLVESIWREFKTEGRRFPIAYIMEAADDIAYCISDLEDSFEKGIVTRKSAAKEIQKRYASKEFPDSAPCNLEISAILESLVKGDPEKFTYTNFRTALTTEIVRYAADRYLSEHDKILSGELDSLVSETDPPGFILSTLKEYCRENVYTHEAVQRVEIAGYTAIFGLMEQVRPLLNCSRERFEAACRGEKEDINKKKILLEPKLLKLFPTRYKKVYEYEVNKAAGLKNENFLEWNARAHLIVDFISGMTDDFAMTTYRTLAGMRL